MELSQLIFFENLQLDYYTASFRIFLYFVHPSNLILYFSVQSTHAIFSDLQLAQLNFATDYSCRSSISPWCDYEVVNQQRRDIKITVYSIYCDAPWTVVAKHGTYTGPVRACMCVRKTRSNWQSANAARGSLVKTNKRERGKWKASNFRGITNGPYAAWLERWKIFYIVNYYRRFSRIHRQSSVFNRAAGCWVHFCSQFRMESEDGGVSGTGRKAPWGQGTWVCKTRGDWGEKREKQSGQRDRKIAAFARNFVFSRHMMNDNAEMYREVYCAITRTR